MTIDSTLFVGFFTILGLFASGFVWVLNRINAGIKATAAHEQEQRHALAARTQQTLTEHDKDIEILKREAVRRSDLTDMEARHSSALEQLRGDMKELRLQINQMISTQGEVKGLLTTLLKNQGAHL